MLLTLKMVTSNSLAHSQCLLSIHLSRCLALEHHSIILQFCSFFQSSTDIQSASQHCYYLAMRDISTKTRFSPSNQLSITSAPCIVSTPSPNPLEFSFQLDTSPTTTPDPNSKLKPTRGDYKRDLASREFKLQWNSCQELLIWLKEEQQKKMIELQHQMYCNNTNGTLVDYYSCAQDGTGGLKKYTKKFPERERKNPSKQCSCPCHLLVKSYPDTDVLMGK